MHDVIIVNTFDGIFTDAKLYINWSAFAGSHVAGWPVTPRPAARPIATLITSDAAIINVINSAFLSIHRLSEPTDYKSQIVGPNYIIYGAWGNCMTNRGSYHKQFNIIYDQIVGTASASCSPVTHNFSDFTLISKFVMDRFRPDGIYNYSCVSNDHKGMAIMLSRNHKNVTFWGNNNVEFGNKETYKLRTTSIANPKCAEEAEGWLHG